MKPSLPRAALAAIGIEDQAGASATKLGYNTAQRRLSAGPLVLAPM